MKTKLLALSLFAFTAAAVAFYPVQKSIGTIEPTTIIKPPPVITNERPKVEVVFVLDTTGSMSGLIKAAKEKIWSIANTMANSPQAPEIKIGLIAYRDRGDAYITQITDLSSDLDSMYATLLDFQAGGGGDGPESVNQALYEAVHNISWSQDNSAYKAIFLIGDAPPHMDYQDEMQYPESIKVAQQRGIIVNTIQCGQNQGTIRPWQQIAQLGVGEYFQIEQGGNAVAIDTPFDRSIAELSVKLDDTRLYYGDEALKAAKKRKTVATQKLHREASVASRARRAAFNVSKSGESNLLGENELVEEVMSGRIELDDIDSEQLPASIQAMEPEEQRAVIAEKAEQRQELKQQIATLTKKRNVYLKEKVDKMGGAKASLDHKIYSAVRKQAKNKGLDYMREDAVY